MAIGQRRDVAPVCLMSAAYSDKAYRLTSPEALTHHQNWGRFAEAISGVTVRPAACSDCSFERASNDPSVD